MSDSPWAHVVSAEDRAQFKRCRRAWDLGARSRQNLEPVASSPRSLLEAGLGEALAVYYFPGMWEWPREVVEPLVREGFLKAMRASGSGLVDADLEAGLAILEQYFEWAPTVDRFTPIRVAGAFEVELPDPHALDSALTAADGRPIHFRGWIELLVIDDADVYWVVSHRLVDPDFAERELLVLDEASVTACWGWERDFLGMRIGGTIANELRLAAASAALPEHPVPDDWHGRSPPEPARRRRADRLTTTHRRMYAQPRGAPGTDVRIVGDERFRRTQIPRSPAELAASAASLVDEAREMTDTAVAVYPHPTAANCGPCPYRHPCVTQFVGDDPAPILADRFRTRPPEIEEGRLGGGTWSTNRGAAPPRFRDEGGSR